MLHRQNGQRINPSIAQDPDAWLQYSRPGFNALLEAAFSVESEDGHAVEIDSLVPAADGVDDRLAFVSPLTDPKRAATSTER